MGVLRNVPVLRFPLHATMWPYNFAFRPEFTDQRVRIVNWTNTLGSLLGASAICVMIDSIGRMEADAWAG